MEGPGGYQLVGRTTQVWNRFRRAGLFAEHPWALRFFDQIEWYPVSAEELLDLRAETEAGGGRAGGGRGVSSPRWSGPGAAPRSCSTCGPRPGGGAGRWTWPTAGSTTASTRGS